MTRVLYDKLYVIPFAKGRWEVHMIMIRQIKFEYLTRLYLPFELYNFELSKFTRLVTLLI